MYTKNPGGVVPGDRILHKNSWWKVVTNTPIPGERWQLELTNGVLTERPKYGADIHISIWEPGDRT